MKLPLSGCKIFTYIDYIYYKEAKLRTRISPTSQIVLGYTEDLHLNGNHYSIIKNKEDVLSEFKDQLDKLYKDIEDSKVVFNMTRDEIIDKLDTVESGSSEESVLIHALRSN